MKKKLVYTLAAAVAATTTPAVSVVPTLANANTSVNTNEKNQVKTITKAQDFVDVYCSLQQLDAKGKLLNTRVLITEVNDKNYQLILSGKTVYESLSESMKIQIDDILNKELASVAASSKTTQLYTCYADMVFAAQTIDKQMNPENYQEAVTTPQTPVDPQEEANTPPTTTDSQTSTQTVDKEDSTNQQEISKPEKEETSNDDESKEDTSKKEDLDNESKDNTAKEDFDDELKDDTSKKEDVKEETDNKETNDKKADETTDEDKKSEDEKLSDKTTEEPVEDEKFPDKEEEAVYPTVMNLTVPRETKTVERKETKTIAVNDTTQEQTTSVAKDLLKNATLPKQEAEDTTAQSFVNSYLTSSAGNVYAKANSLNYKNILNGLSSWNKLTSAQRTDVNAILNKNVGKTYQTLLKEAQQIQFNGASSTSGGSTSTRRVNTATETQSGLYGALMGLSIALAGFIARKRKEQ